MGLQGRSQEEWKKLWTNALSEGRCPFTGCDIRTSTCEHLDHYLKSLDETRRSKPAVLITPDIDLFFVEPSIQQEHPVWEAFKILRKKGLHRDQIEIICRRVAGQTFRAITEEMGWTDHTFAFRRLKAAIKTLGGSKK